MWMEVIAFYLLVQFIVIAIIVSSLYRSAKRVKKSQLYTLPGLGIQDHDGTFREDMEILIRHLDDALAEEYVERVKERMIRKHRISLTEWENRWFEWKRFLVMTALLKRVPMYSREVDEVWHEMLMFTREYEEFSKKFLKTVLHHAPNAPAEKFDPHERAWFDTIYVLLFKPTPYSHATWGPLLRHPLSPALLEEFKKGSVSELAVKYFNEHTQLNLPGVARLVRFLIRYLQRELEQIEQHVYEKGTSVSQFLERWPLHSRGEWPLWMLRSVLFLSWYYVDEFFQQYTALNRAVQLQFPSISGTGDIASFACAGWDGGIDSGGGNSDGSVSEGKM
jgi:hypothetical protein